MPISPDQRDDLGAAFKRDFAKAQRLADRDLTNQKLQEEWGCYCLEMAAFSLLFGNIAEAADHAERAVGVWRGLSQAAPTNLFYQTRLAQARVALGAFQLRNRQPQAAIQTALRGLELDSNRVEFKAMLALGCLFAGQLEKARAILRENKDLQVGPRLTFSQAVLDDLHRLREKGLTSPDLETIEKLLLAGPGNASE